MWRETRGRWEGSPDGKFLEQISRFRFFCGFPAMYRFQIFGFLRGFQWFFRGPKIFSKRGFFRSVLEFWRTGLSKNSSQFSCYEQGSKFGSSRGVPQFLGDPENSQNVVFPRSFSGFWRMGSSKIFRKSDFPAVFSGFWRVRPTQKISEPTDLSVVFLGF